MKSFKTSSVLLSRQPLRPSRQTPWIGYTIEAVQWIGQNQFILYTSLGMQTWEFLIYLAQHFEINQIILIPTTDQHEFESLRENTLDQFKLDPNLVRFKAVTSKHHGKQKHDLLKARDHAAVSGADILVPICIRPGGHMEKLLNTLTTQNTCLINRQYQIDYRKRNRTIAYRIEKGPLLPGIIKLTDRFVIHWTRASNGPWPDEKKYQYYSDIQKYDVYPRSAFHTLQRILKTGKIMASSLHKVKRETPTVSFSGLAPSGMIPLMKWRSRYRQMAFEPYGIGIEKDEAKRLGILPVHYYRKGEYVKNQKPWRLQSAGMRTNWERELEYRYPGDLHLSDTELNKIVCFCHTQDEAAVIEKKFGIKTYAFYNNNSDT